MSFTINLGVNHSENTKADKNVDYSLDLEGNLRENCSLKEPIFLIETSENISNYNYCKIDIFGRAYFMSSPKFVRTNLYEIHLKCDVLSSFISEIRENSAIVKRQENLWNLYVDDGSFRTYQNSNVVVNKFPSGFTDKSFVLCVSGG